MDRETRFRLGAAVTIGELERDPHAVHDRLRPTEPVSWVPVLGGWVVTSHRLCVEVMRDADMFTVDDPRFTTGQVVGPSMLTLEGEQHTRHRDPFTAAFRRSPVRARFALAVRERADALIGRIAERGTADLRASLAGPLAVDVVAMALELGDSDPGEVLAIYRAIVASVEALSVGEQPPEAGAAAMVDLRERVVAAMEAGGTLLASAAETLTESEVVSNAAVLMFGGIETCEGMTANALFHLLSSPDHLAPVLNDRARVAQVVEESLRLEPAATRVDRYATRDVDLGGASIGAGELVIVSLAGANRDPDVFDRPHLFDPGREGGGRHLTFAQGPHLCLGRHLARLETIAAINAVLDGCVGITLVDANAEVPTGLVFRKPHTLWATWGALR